VDASFQSVFADCRSPVGMIYIRIHAERSLKEGPPHLMQVDATCNQFGKSRWRKRKRDAGREISIRQDMQESHGHWVISIQRGGQCGRLLRQEKEGEMNMRQVVKWGRERS